MFSLRFDLRAPASGAPPAELYAAALDMAEWAESRGAVLAVVCEHHRQPDGYLPSPIAMAAALAARTTTLRILVAAVVLPLYEPVRLAEEMIVLDLISRGRVSYVAAVGYRPEEYELFGVDFHRRGRIADEHLAILLPARSGRPFQHDGRELQLTPPPFTPGGPSIAWGGRTPAAARRAGRNGLDLFAQRGDATLRAAYEAAARAAGVEPGWCYLPADDMATCVFVSDDLDGAWEELGPYLLHDATAYAAMNEPADASASISFAPTVDALRAERASHRIVTVDEAISMARGGLPLPLHPLVGGLPPDIAWRYLRTVADEVVPGLASDGG